MEKLNSFILNYRGVREEVELGVKGGGEGGRDLNKWNWGNDIYAMELIPLKSYKESFVFL